MLAATALILFNLLVNTKSNMRHGGWGEIGTNFIYNSVIAKTIMEIMENHEAKLLMTEPCDMRHRN